MKYTDWAARYVKKLQELDPTLEHAELWSATGHIDWSDQFPNDPEAAAEAECRLWAGG